MEIKPKKIISELWHLNSLLFFSL